MAVIECDGAASTSDRQASSSSVIGSEETSGGDSGQAAKPRA